MNLDEIKRWSLSEPSAVQQYVGELVAMVEAAQRLFTPGEMVAAKAEARRQAFLEAAEFLQNETDDYPGWLSCGLTLRQWAATALRLRAEEEK